MEEWQGFLEHVGAALPQQLMTWLGHGRALARRASGRLVNEKRADFKQWLVDQMDNCHGRGLLPW